jgi:spore germination protein YaaH
MKKYFFLIITLIIILSSVSGGYYASEVFQKEDSMSIFYDQKLIRDQVAYLINKEPYLPCSMLNSYFVGKGMTIDDKNSVMKVDISNKNIIMGNQEIENFIKTNVTTIEIPLRKIEEQNYFPLDVLQTFFQVRYEIRGKQVHILKNDGDVLMGTVNKSKVKLKPSVLNPILSEPYLDYNARVRIVKETDNYYKVDTGSVTGYIQKEDITVHTIDYGTIDYYGEIKKKNDYVGKKINLIWEYVNKFTPEASAEKIEQIEVISPTWFYLKDREGNVGNKADRGYANQVKGQGYELWGLMTNSFNGEWTQAVLSNEALVNKVIAQMLFYSSLYDLDGINIDFESVNDNDRDNFTNFMKKLRYYTELQGLSLTVDVMVPRAWTIEYDRKALSNYTDYMAVMTYDEHWSASPIAGSVASYNWVEDNIQRTLQEGVPKEKLLLGIPLYTRLWTTENGKVSSKTLYMEDVKTIIREKGLQPTWLEDAKQYYLRYEEAGKICEIWIEDFESIEWKRKLIDRYGLAGSAYWRKGFETVDFWNK